MKLASIFLILISSNLAMAGSIVEFVKESGILADGTFSAELQGRVYENNQEFGFRMKLRTRVIETCFGNNSSRQDRRIGIGTHSSDFQDSNRADLCVQLLPIDMIVRIKVAGGSEAPSRFDLERIKISIFKAILFDGVFTAEAFSFIKKKVETSALANEDLIVTGGQILTLGLQGNIDIDEDGDYELTLRSTFGIGIGTATVPEPVEVGAAFLVEAEAGVGLMIHRRVLLEVFGGADLVGSINRDLYTGAQARIAFMDSQINLNLRFEYHDYNWSDELSTDRSDSEYRLTGGVGFNW